MQELYCPDHRYLGPETDRLEPAPQTRLHRSAWEYGSSAHSGLPAKKNSITRIRARTESRMMPKQSAKNSVYSLGSMVRKDIPGRLSCSRMRDTADNGLGRRGWPR